jgi:hypothetical protein
MDSAVAPTMAIVMVTAAVLAPATVITMPPVAAKGMVKAMATAMPRAVAMLIAMGIAEPIDYCCGH